jgi:integrase
LSVSFQHCSQSASDGRIHEDRVDEWRHDNLEQTVTSKNRKLMNLKRKGQAVLRHAKNFLRWRIRPISDRLQIPARPITFQVMRRSLGTHLSGHGTLKDTQGALRHASITTTGNVYVQVVEENVMRAVNSHATTVLEGWTPAVEAWI